MQMQPQAFGRRRVGRPRRLKLTYANLTPRLRAFYEAALATGGDIGRMMRRMEVSRGLVNQRISILRGLGLARTVHLYDPRIGGKDLEFRTLVRLASHTPETIADFEAWCVQERAITCAVWLCGRFDYQLTSFHPNLREAEHWRRLLELRDEVAKVEQRHVRTLYGHQLAGLPLLDSDD